MYIYKKILWFWQKHSFEFENTNVLQLDGVLQFLSAHLFLF